MLCACLLLSMRLQALLCLSQWLASAVTYWDIMHVSCAPGRGIQEHGQLRILCYSCNMNE